MCNPGKPKRNARANCKHNTRAQPPNNARGKLCKRCHCTHCTSDHARMRPLGTGHDRSLLPVLLKLLKLSARPASRSPTVPANSTGGQCMAMDDSMRTRGRIDCDRALIVRLLHCLWAHDGDMGSLLVGGGLHDGDCTLIVRLLLELRVHAAGVDLLLVWGACASPSRRQRTQGSTV
eukprot:UN4187